MIFSTLLSPSSSSSRLCSFVGGPSVSVSPLPLSAGWLLRFCGRSLSAGWFLCLSEPLTLWEATLSLWTAPLFLGGLSVSLGGPSLLGGASVSLVSPSVSVGGLSLLGGLSVFFSLTLC